MWCTYIHVLYASANVPSRSADMPMPARCSPARYAARGWSVPRLVAGWRAAGVIIMALFTLRGTEREDDIQDTLVQNGASWAKIGGRGLLTFPSRPGSPAPMGQPVE